MRLGVAMQGVTTLFTGALLAAAASLVAAQEQLGKAELTALLSGNTVHFSDLQSGQSGRAYHDAGGEIVVERNDGSTFSGLWSVRDDGAHCMIVSGEICSRILKSGDGTYTRVIIGDGRRFQWVRITPGKAF
jgi:hypothetical protein